MYAVDNTLHGTYDTFQTTIVVVYPHRTPPTSKGHSKQLLTLIYSLLRTPLIKNYHFRYLSYTNKLIYK